MVYWYEKTVDAVDLIPSGMADFPFVLSDTFGLGHTVQRMEWQDNLSKEDQKKWFDLRVAMPWSCAGEQIRSVNLIHSFRNDAWHIRYAFGMLNGLWDRVYIWVEIFDDLIALQVKLQLT